MQKGTNQKMLGTMMKKKSMKALFDQASGCHLQKFE
jgi:hypothetical protein